jgi:hypothetical protein
MLAHLAELISAKKAHVLLIVPKIEADVALPALRVVTIEDHDAPRDRLL